MKNCLDLEMMMLEPYIYELDLDKDQDLWDKFKQVLQEHLLLEEGEECCRHVDRPDMVE